MKPSRYRGSLAVWALLLVYASLYPFISLRLPAPDAVPGFFVNARQVIRSDVAFNVVAYVPFGMLACLHFRQMGVRRPIAAAVLLGAALSLAMEIIQLFVPNRVASVVDLASNSLGALVGAAAFADPFYTMLTRPLGEARERLLIPGAWGDAGLMLVMLWLLAQLNPALPFFGAGDVGGEDAIQVALLQPAAVAMGVCGFGLFVATLVRVPEGSLRVTLVLLSVALWLKFAAAGVLLQPHFAESWMSAGRMAGLAIGLAAFFPLRRMPRPGRIYVAFLLILASALFAKIFGSYSAVEELLRLFRWPHGQLGSFATLTRFLHELWPVAAITYLIALFFRERRGMR